MYEIRKLILILFPSRTVLYINIFNWLNVFSWDMVLLFRDVYIYIYIS